MSRLLQDAVSEFAKLPGIGRRTALRLAMHLLKMDADAVEQMTDTLARYRREIRHISPMQGVGPSDLKIDMLVDKVASGRVKEVILAISTSVEGETTLFYIMNRLKQFPSVRVTNIARGIGFGDELEYVDELTITHALHNRREVE